MKLRIITPLSVVVATEVRSLRAVDDSGSFGIMPGHADFLTRLAISVVSWHEAAGARFCAVRGGVLTVSGGQTIVLASREAVPGPDLATLDQTVLARFRSDLEEERTEHTEATRLHLSALRHLIGRLKQRPGAGGLS